MVGIGSLITVPEIQNTRNYAYEGMGGGGGGVGGTGEGLPWGRVWLGLICCRV